MKKIFLLLSIALIGLQSCDNKESIDLADNDQMVFNIKHPSLNTRATETSFENSDKVGIFLTDSDKNLDLIGNYKDNLPLTFDGAAWNAASPVYWNNGTYNAYAYFPYNSEILSIDNYAFEVALDQSTNEGYGNSDFMWAGTKDVTADANGVELLFNHRMSRIMVTLKKSAEFIGDLPEDAEVYIHNTIPQATIDLAAGYPSTASNGAAKTIKAKKIATGKYAAIIVPQRIDYRVPLVEVVADGVSYMFTTRFAFKTGVQHNVDFTISKNPSQIKIELGGEIGNWN